MEVMDLIRLHLALEGVGIDAAGQMVRIPCPDPDTLHRVYFIRHARGVSLFFQAGLPQVIRERLQQLPSADFFTNPQRVESILEENGTCAERHIGKSYIFPDTISAALYPDVVRLAELDDAMIRRLAPGYDPRQKEVFCVLVDGEIAAACESSRENDFAGEAWVQTHEPYRRRGYARQVTAAWGHWLQQHGKTPFYSHKLENLASQAVARSLGLVQYIEDAGYA
jgi:GNAT superfamily N-acetyltransferase